jgi:1-phosphofructokinase family hexose kinase
MKTNNSSRIITVGLSPAWDVSCRGKDLDWGRHAEIDAQVVRPAGKALNVSRALAWMGRESVAAGLWGREDYEPMLEAVQRLGGLVQARMTRVGGHTRRNVTVVDTRRRREMHLRCKSTLASVAALRRLGTDLRSLVRENDICVFSGALPAGPLLKPTVALVRACRDSGARIVIDAHGPTLEAIVDAGLAWLIAPNVEELGGLLGARVPDTPARLARAARGLLDKVELVLVSRGKKGAMAVTRTGVSEGYCVSRGKVLETVGCGDYLLAGFLAGLGDSRQVRAALVQGLKAATARAWGRTETETWRRTKGQIRVQTTRLPG